MAIESCSFVQVATFHITANTGLQEKQQNNLIEHYS